MSTLDLLPELADRLDTLVPAEVVAGDWTDVLRRADPPARSRRRFVLKLAIAIALFLLLAGIATATYLVSRPHPSGARPRPPAALTVISGGYSPYTPAEIVRVLSGDRLDVLWPCPIASCGEMTSVDWAPDGRHVAFTLDAWNPANPYLGLHIVDTRTGRDIHLPRTDARRLGCISPGAVAWSPDSKYLAYACRSAFRQNENRRDTIVVIRSDGSRPRRIATGPVVAVGWPTWSPNGKRIAFEAWTRRKASPSIYVMALDGSGRVRVARNASKPDWSPDGTTIAYRSPDGIRFVTPDGVDAAPAVTRGRHARIRLRGAPAWSPDGSTLAIATRRGVFVVPAAGGRAKLVTSAGGDGVFGPLHPAWYPGGKPPRANAPNARRPAPPKCGAC